MGKEELTEKERLKMLWFLDCSMEDLLIRASEEDWRQSNLDNWVRFKTAQFLEKIAFSKS